MPRHRVAMTSAARRALVAALAFAAGIASPAPAATEAPALAPGLVHPGYHEPPKWFKETFLDLKDDVAEAAKAGRRVMVYFYQDGCPYCAKLLQENFGDKALAEKTRRHFDVIALNLWGDREVTDLDGKATTEKAFAKALRVQFTPTLVVLDEKGATALRLNGYRPPHEFDVALDFARAGSGAGASFTGYLASRKPARASGRLHAQPWLMAPPLALAGRAGKPLLVLFEQKVCAACDELHGEGFARPEVAALLPAFRAARVDIVSREAVTTPAGEATTMRDWARALGIAYTPSLVFFDGEGREVFRVDGYLRPFHLASSLDYVASGAYRREPEFQRFIEARAAARRARGEKVELMK
ncbi:MAG: thioredoxin fold domain-containing protein [Burkholderiales bacterium]|nr:thioredoxin fold domain-containing protein [Burkholderiales bacterium]